ncbi:MAG: antibiotic biosynthesis monooxygenase [Alloprevotella sp.]|nr:antibiotic biosynthesis monooxygenase [Alloprevotella sp.]
MLRINAFFTLKEGVSKETLLQLTNELVAKSRKDEGNKGYDLFQSTTNERVFMFCETWESKEALDKHSQAPHFTTAVPQIAALTEDGLKLEVLEK